MRRLDALALALCASACVERAPGSGRRAAFDRRAAAPYLAPAGTPRHAARAVFGNAIELTGWDLDPDPPVAGAPATLTLRWRALDDVEASYRVFVHLDRRGGEARIHADHAPAAGTLPTEAWRRGDAVRDPVRLAFPASDVGATYDLWVGWYLGPERLPISNAAEVQHDGASRLLLGAVTLAR